MYKNLGIGLMALAGMLMLAHPQKADAAVRLGVSVGPPVYSYPVDAYRNVAPCPESYNGYPVTTYGYAAPAYVAPSYGFGWRDRDRHEFRERENRVRNERREHDERAGWRR